MNKIKNQDILYQCKRFEKIFINPDRNQSKKSFLENLPKLMSKKVISLANNSENNNQ